MAKLNPTKDPEFQRILGNLIKTPPKRHSEMKIGKQRKAAKPSAHRVSAKPKSA